MSTSLATVSRAAPDPRIERVLGVLRQLDRPLRMDELARECCMSRSHLHRLFRKATGLSPARVRKDLRMQEVARLLAATEFPIKEVAARAGFGDLSHFVRDFERVYGASPSVYRVRARGAFSSDSNASAPGGGIRGGVLRELRHLATISVFTSETSRCTLEFLSLTPSRWKSTGRQAA
jgi:AraC-like DNA-binding protein